MKMTALLAILITVAIAGSAPCVEKRAFQIRDDYGMEPLSECALQYYYYIPCPTYSWFWAYSGWDHGDIVGAWFQIGDPATGGHSACDPDNCHTLDQFRVLDFAGYGSVHHLFLVQFDVYCADEYGCPIGPSLWNSGDMGIGFGWNYIDIDPPISICDCSVNPGPPPSGPRVVVTATHTGLGASYPAWGFDDISDQVELGCDMHDFGCLPVLYPRPYSSYYTTMHSGYYGNWDFEYCPPRWFLDGNDTTPDGSLYGFVELAWRLYLTCAGPTEIYPTTWGTLKSMYR